MNWGNLLLQFFLCYVSTVCFGILLNIPKRAYHTAGMIGGGVWVVYWIMYYCSGIGLPFVPGGQAYKMVRNFAIGNYHLVNVYFYQVVVIVGAITLGFGLGELLNRVLNYLHKYLIKKS